MDVIDLLRVQPLLLITAAGLLGLLVGSFLNVVAYRLPVMLERQWRAECAELLTGQDTDATLERFDLVHPRSHCPHCGHGIRAWENVPLLSFLFLRGRCSSCGERIPWRYPLVELGCGLLSALVAWRLGFGWPLLAALAFTWASLALTLIDLDHQLLPDAITLPLLWLGLLCSLGHWFTDPTSAILGAVAGYLVLWSLYQLFRLLTRKEGMGYGDFKLLAAAGAWLGWQQLPLVILLSSFVGALVGITLIVARGRDRNLPIPFGPYLATAAWIALLWGPDLTRAYLRFAGL